MTAFTESEVEQVTRQWLVSIGWAVMHGPDAAPDTVGAERLEYDAVVLEGRLRDALARQLLCSRWFLHCSSSNCRNPWMR